MRDLADYADKYADANISRNERGVLEVVFHTDGGPLTWSERLHRELPQLFNDIATDRENRVVIITGTGDVFLRLGHGGSFASEPYAWDKKYVEGKRLIYNFVDIEAPVIAAINGPVSVHAEIPVLADIVLASESTTLSDLAHFPIGVVPADGVHLIWPLLLGMNRGRYFLLTGQVLSAKEAYDLGVVNEVLPGERLMERARELAEDLATRTPLTLRYTRVALNMLLHRMLHEQVGYGLSLEGLAMLELAAVTREKD
jgi:enoyl-CoA hydratase/carnithine racemase